MLLIPAALIILTAYQALKGREREQDAFDAHNARLMDIRDGH